MKKNILMVIVAAATLLASCTKKVENKASIWMVKRSIFSPEIILGTAD